MTEELIGKILTGGSVGVIATLLLVLWLLLTEKLVVGAVYRRDVARLDVYEKMAIRAMDLVERTAPKVGP